MYSIRYRKSHVRFPSTGGEKLNIPHSCTNRAMRALKSLSSGIFPASSCTLFQLKKIEILLPLGLCSKQCFPLALVKYSLKKPCLHAFIYNVIIQIDRELRQGHNRTLNSPPPPPHLREMKCWEVKHTM